MFIDWLTIYQKHEPGTIPVLGEDIVCTFDLDTGDQTREYIRGYNHPGSYDTSIRIRSDGSVIEVSGNPSRYGRPSNLFGRSSIDECITLYNRILEGLNLPGFYDLQLLHSVREMQISSTDAVVIERPIITRVDVTENYKTENVMQTIRHLSSHHYRTGSGHLYANGRTTDWNRGSRRVYVKYYDKGYEMSMRKKTERNDEREQEYCKYHNIIRFEASFKSMWLKRNGLDDPRHWHESTLSEITEPYRFHERQQTEITDLDNVVKRLMAFKIKEADAKRAELYLRSWLQGANLYESLSRRTYYRYRKILLNLGLDIRNPCDISTLPVRTRKLVLEPVAVPEWYELPPGPETICA